MVGQEYVTKPKFEKAVSYLNQQISALRQNGLSGGGSGAYDPAGTAETLIETHETDYWHFASVLEPTHGGTGLSAYAAGDMIYASAVNTLAALAKGTAAQYLKGGDAPSWATLNQAAVAGLTTADSPAFVNVKLSGLADGFFPYHVNDATGFADSPLKRISATAITLNSSAGVTDPDTWQFTIRDPGTANVCLGIVQTNAAYYCDLEWRNEAADKTWIWSMRASTDTYPYHFGIGHHDGTSWGGSYFRMAPTGEGYFPKNTVTFSYQIISTLAIGTMPLNVTSTTLCTNLNADLWDGYQFSDYLDQAVKQASSPIFKTVKCSDLTTNYIPYHVDDATGFANAPMDIQAAGVVRVRYAGNAELRIDTIGGSNNNSILRFLENTTDRASLYWEGSGNHFYVTTTTGNIYVTPAAYLHLSPTNYIYANSRLVLNADLNALNYTKTQTDPASATSIFILTSTVEYTGAESAAESFYVINTGVKVVVNAGHTNSSTISNANYNALRNNAAAGSDDDGTLSYLIANRSYYGHADVNATGNPQTTYSYGLQIIPWRKTGTIGTAVDIILEAEVGAGAVTNAYGIRQYNTKLNSFAGNIALGLTASQVSGCGGTQLIAIENATAPTVSITDSFIFYAKDFAAGNSCPYFRTENGTIIGLNQSLLTTDNVTFVQGTFTTLTSPAATNLTIAPTGDVIFNPTGNDILPTTNYDLNLGSLSKKYLTLHAAELWVETLVAQETIATIGGRILVAPTTLLVVDLASGDTTIHVKHNNLANGDRIYLEANGKVEFMAVTSGAGGGAGDYTYSVTRNLDGSGANDWYAGDAILNTGTTGDGFIDIYSIRGVKSASEYGPTIVGNVRTGTTYNQWDARWAAGNLNGLYGYSTDIYGFAAGEAAETWVAIDSTNGFRVMHGAAVKTQIDASGNASFVGSITAAAGAIGGWVIGATDLKDAAGVVGMSSAVTAGDDIRFWAGHATPSSAPFYVTEAGVIKASSGTIGGFTLGSTELYAGSGATRIEFQTSTGLWLGATAYADAPFSVSLAGALKSTSGTIGGWTLNATSLYATFAKLVSGGGNGYASFGATPPTSYGDNEGVWIGSSSGVGKLSIYKDANNYLKFDGANLSLKTPYVTLDSHGIYVAPYSGDVPGTYNGYYFDVSSYWAGMYYFEGASTYGLVIANEGGTSPSVGIHAGEAAAATDDAPYVSIALNTLAAGVSSIVFTIDAGADPVPVGSEFLFVGAPTHSEEGFIRKAAGASIGVSGLVPEGTIISWCGGYFVDGSNGTYNRVLGTANTVAAINALWNSYGWYVCDGAALNLATSTIFNGAGRYLPNLTNDRFLMGDTTVGGTGGSNSSAHTHSFSDTSTSDGSHSHNVSGTSGAGSSHKHAVNPPATNSATSATTGAANECGSGTRRTFNLSTHVHSTDIASFDSKTEAAHTHGAGSYAAASDGAHTHDVSGTTGAASATENRPKYLSVVYLMYVLAA